ncbi:unnamed protein product [Hyaloperonospora brassicae]|uniref:Uncharacterized protein n=1 Tax=Hyaloperonospora brassicae TaxID=162125 RepID=A0AAV0TT91_HYABA|nr:unnamed protein product [Hyaloperonospora brassicae]
MRGSVDPSAGELPAPGGEPPDPTVGEQRSQLSEISSQGGKSKRNCDELDGAPAVTSEKADAVHPSQAPLLPSGIAPGGDFQTGDEPIPSPKVPTPLKDQPLPSQPAQATNPESPRQPVPVVRPQDMYSALVEARQAALTEPPRDAWTTSLAELFAIVHGNVKVDAELVPPEKKRFPKLRRDEKVVLFQFFEVACVNCNAPYATWADYATKAIQTLYNTNWTFTPILQNMISKVKWARLKPINQWASAPKRDSGINEGGDKAPDHENTYKTFMFNPAVYNLQDIATLRSICMQPATSNSGSRLRAGTLDEWRIITGLAEGSIVCRRLPVFLKSVLDSKERVRLSRTIQAQVEGELVLHLRSGLNIRLCRQSTSAIKEDILLAAERLRVDQEVLRRFLNVAKTISYNPLQRCIHFYFFDRVTARNFELVAVPFRGVIYRVANQHPPSKGSVWARQIGRDGTRLARVREYAVELHNVTRFTDIGRLTAYLQEHIAADFELEDLDSCTPNSRTSTVWRLTIKMAGCPDFLREIVRIMWFGRPIILKHPEEAGLPPTEK